MYVRDELGGFSECAYSLLLSISFLLTHREAVISEQLVTASLRFYTESIKGRESVQRVYGIC